MVAVVVVVVFIVVFTLLQAGVVAVVLLEYSCSCGASGHMTTNDVMSGR